MIVILRLEVNEAERNLLSRRTHPKALKRLATGAEMKTLLADLWASNIKGQDEVIAKNESYRPFDESQEMRFSTPAVAMMEHIAAKDEIGTPVVVSKTPLMGFRKMVHHVNCAMFSIANARRMARNDQSPSEYQLDELSKDIEALRENLAIEHDARDDLEDDN